MAFPLLGLRMGLLGALEAGRDDPKGAFTPFCFTGAAATIFFGAEVTGAGMGAVLEAVATLVGALFVFTVL